MYLSNVNGIIRANSILVAVLRCGEAVVVDRQFLIRLASIPDARIIASTWNVETIDPAMMRMTVDAKGVLTLEELFTTHGLSVVVGDGKPVKLGLLGDNPTPQEEMLRNKFAETLGKLRDRTRSCVAEKGQEGRLQEIRDQLLADVAQAIRKETPNGVVMLALELAAKEVIAPLYNKAIGNERISTVDNDTVTLLNAIIDELTGWIQTDSSAALSAAAIDKVIDRIAHDLPMQGLDAMMRQELPKTQAQHLEEEQIHFEDLCRNAEQFLAKFLTVSSVSRDVHHIAKQISKTENQEEQQELRAGLDQAVKKMMQETMIQTLIRLSIRGHLIRIEREKRKEFGALPQKAGEQLVTNQDLDDIIRRYNEYARYIDPAFQERIKNPLNTVIKAFQEGSVDEQAVTINPKGFISHVVTLRHCGGKIETDSESTVPAITCLNSIPDAIPDIHVEQPDRAVAKGFVRVVHREGQLMEVDFAAVAHASDIPSGVPGALWFAFHDFTVRYMNFHLAVTGHKVDQKQQDLITRQFTQKLLLKVFNLFRGLKSLSVTGNFTGIQAFLGEANGIAEMRLGENANEEVLDLRDRSGGIVETAMNLKNELKQIIVELRKDGAISGDAFRLKRPMPSYASGGGPKVKLPITMTARRGTVTIEALFDDKPFKKSVRLTGKEGEIVEESAEEKPVSKELRKIPVSKDRAHIQAVREHTEKLSRKGVSQLLNGLEFFRDFSNHEKDRVSEFDVGFQFTKPMDVLIRENTKDTAFFILIKGRVAAIKGGVDGKNGKVLFNLGPGDIIGELAFLTGSRRTLNIVAQEKGLLLRVDNQLLGRLGCDSREKFKDQLINKLVQRLADTTNRVQKTAHDDRPDPLRARASGPTNQGELKQISREETIERINRIAFFDLFSTFEKRRITAFNTSFYSYPAATYVINEGDIDTAFFILIDGRVTVIKGGTEITELGAGEFFGDMAFLTNLPRSTGVCSKTEILVLRVDQALLKRLGSEIREKIKDRLIRKLCERLIQTTGLME